MALGFRSAKNIGIYSEFLLKVSKICENTAYLTIFRVDKNAKISCCCKNKNNNNNNNNNNNKKKNKNAIKRCVARWLHAAVWQEHHTVLCTCARPQSTWTTPTLTLLYIALMASPVCEALQYIYIYYIYIHRLYLFFWHTWCGVPTTNHHIAFTSLGLVSNVAVMLSIAKHSQSNSCSDTPSIGPIPTHPGHHKNLTSKNAVKYTVSWWCGRTLPRSGVNEHCSKTKTWAQPRPRQAHNRISSSISELRKVYIQAIHGYPLSRLDRERKTHKVCNGLIKLNKQKGPNRFDCDLVVMSSHVLPWAKKFRFSLLWSRSDQNTLDPFMTRGMKMAKSKTCWTHPGNSVMSTFSAPSKRSEAVLKLKVVQLTDVVVGASRKGIPKGYVGA